MDQPVNDLDFFFIGGNPETDLLKLKAFTSAFMTHTQVDDYIIIHKTNSEVFEILGVKTVYTEQTKVFNLADGNSTIIPPDTDHEIIYKVQLILKSFPSLERLFDNFDLDASCAGFYDDKLLFAQRGMYAYKYMANYVREEKLNDQFDYRLQKYFNTGFSIIMSAQPETKNFQINKTKIYGTSTDSNIVVVDRFKVDSKIDSPTRTLPVYRNEGPNTKFFSRIKSYISDHNKTNDSKIYYKFGIQDFDFETFENGASNVEFCQI